jgi:hypothetical protein
MLWWFHEIRRFARLRREFQNLTSKQQRDVLNVVRLFVASFARDAMLPP